MAKAPSEKHLEDWIVANPLWFGEVYEEGFIPEYAQGEDWIHFTDGDFICPFVDRIIARQLRLPTGRADLIAAGSHSVDVIEIKRDSINANTLAQCLKYMYDVTSIFHAVIMTEGNHYAYRSLMKIDVCTYPQSEVNGIMVGYGEPSNDLLVVSALANVAVISYDYEEETNRYWFTRHEYESPAKPSVYDEYAAGAIGDALRVVQKTWYDWHERWDRGTRQTGEAS